MYQFLILSLVLIVSFTGTVTGFGSSTLLVSILTLWFPLTDVLLFAGLIHWFNDIWKVLYFHKKVPWKLIFYFGIPGLLLSYIGASIPFALPEYFLKKALGVFLTGFAIFMIMGKEKEIKHREEHAVLGGSISGFFAGVLGVGGAISSAFISSLNLKKHAYLFMSGMVALLIDTVRITRYYTGGATFGVFDTYLPIFAVPISFVGATMGKNMVEHIPQKKFKRIIAIALGIVGIRFILL